MSGEIFAEHTIDRTDPTWQIVSLVSESKGYDADLAVNPRDGWIQPSHVAFCRNLSSPQIRVVAQRSPTQADPPSGSQVQLAIKPPEIEGFLAIPRCTGLQMSVEYDETSQVNDTNFPRGLYGRFPEWYMMLGFGPTVLFAFDDFSGPMTEYVRANGMDMPYVAGNQFLAAQSSQYQYPPGTRDMQFIPMIQPTTGTKRSLFKSVKTYWRNLTAYTMLTNPLDTILIRWPWNIPFQNASPNWRSVQIDINFWTYFEAYYYPVNALRNAAFWHQLARLDRE